MAATTGDTESLLEHRYSGEHPFRTLLYLYQGDIGRLWAAILVYIVKHSGVWALPILSARIIDVISDPAAHDLSELWLYGGLLAFSYVQNIFSHTLYAYLLSSASHNMEVRLRSALARHLQNLSMHFFRRSSTGALGAKLLRDVEMIEQLTRQVFETVPAAALTIIVAVLATAVRVPWFLLFFLLTVPAAVILFQLLYRPMAVNNHLFRTEVERMSARLMEMIHLIPVARAHGVEEDEVARIQHELQGVRRAGVKLDVSAAVFGASAWVVFRLFDALCLVVSAYMVYTQAIPITVGDVVMLTGFFNALTNSTLQITTVLPQISKGFESIRSLGEILESPDVEHDEGKARVESVRGEFRFESVSFSYEDSDTDSLTDVSFDVPAGQVVAVIGHSGAGKSTLLNLIIGFLRPTSGRILLDGEDMETLDLRTYRRHLSVVTQDTLLFEGTIRDNILFGMTGVDEQRLRLAVEAAHVDAFVDALPLGLDTHIGENGARLSGGQRQRIAIARAIIREPRVLILDEATSALDTESEGYIQAALERLMQGRTTFIVAHRLSTIAYAQRVIVLERGRIVRIAAPHEIVAERRAAS